MSTKKGVCVPEPQAVRFFGRGIKKFARSQDVLLPSFADSWMDGGCAVFAQALKSWSGPHGALHTVVRHAPEDPKEGIPEHVVVKIGNYYLDADGTHTKKSLIHKSIRWYENEPPNYPTLHPDHFELRPLKASDSNGEFIACPIKSVPLLTKRLVEYFGADPALHICPNR